MTGCVCCKPGKSGNKEGGWEVVARLQAEQDTLQLQDLCSLFLQLSMLSGSSRLHTCLFLDGHPHGDFV